MLKIKLRTRYKLTQFKVIDTYEVVDVGPLAFKQGSLYYFRKGQYDYTVLAYDKKNDCYYK